MTFEFNTAFTGNVSTWQTVNAATMASMFEGATALTGNLSAWPVNYVYFCASFGCPNCVALPNFGCNPA
jgi:hypothetical protein